MIHAREDVIPIPHIYHISGIFPVNVTTVEKKKDWGGKQSKFIAALNQSQKGWAVPSSGAYESSPVIQIPTSREFYMVSTWQINLLSSL